MQRKNDPLAQRAGYTPKGIRSLSVDSMAYLNEAEEQIPVDELFLYRYLKKKNEIKQHVKQKDEDNEDVESVNSEEFNDMLDRMGSGQDFDDLDIAANIVSKKKKSNIILCHIKCFFVFLAFLRGSKRIVFLVQI